MKESKLGVMPINRLLIGVSLPIMISMLVQALYNIVDSIFVAQINENALTAVSLAYPVQSLMISIAVGTGVGTNALLSRTLGEKDFEKANRVAANSIFLAVVSFLAFMTVGLLFSRAYFTSQTADPEIVGYGVAYLSIVCIGSLGKFTQIAFERLLQATGKTLYSMVSQAAGALLNIILDPILIFGYFGMPKMGVAGAAVATVIGQSVSAVLAIAFNLKVNRELNLNLMGFRPDAGIIRDIYKVGVPSIVMRSIASVATYGLNNIVIRFSPTACAVLGVYYKLQSFVFMPVFGLNNGMVPIIAYNYGARNRERVTETIKLSITYAVVIMVIGMTVLQLFPGKLLGLFNASEGMLCIGIPALRIISLSYVFAGVSVVASSVYQAFGNGVLSLIVALVRQLVVLLPAAYLLSLLRHVDYVWWAYPLAETITILLNVAFLRRIYTITRAMEPAEPLAER